MPLAALLTLTACAARHVPAAPAMTATPLPKVAPRAEPREPSGTPPEVPDLPRVVVFPDGFGASDAPAGTEMLTVGVASLIEGPVALPLGTGTGTEVTAEDDHVCAGNVAFTPDWTWDVPTGRALRAVDVAEVRPRLERALQRDDFTIAAVWAVDLDGDGPEELVFTLTVEEPTQGWSYVGVLAGEAVTTLQEGGWEVEADDDPDALAQAVERAKPSFERAELWGLTDVDGDGELELVMIYAGWESSGFGASTPDGKRMGGTGCGV